ncbi:hypothetical protein LP420_08165 [Massilia sp. B-10]|nr:hypothetical protein LP420_08165 [Massilia sp. B-10]
MRFSTSLAQLTHPGLLKGPIESTREVTLSAGDSVFSLEFVALHYAAPQRNQFAYQLEGFDEGWVSTDASKRFATYTNLDPGQYTFRVKAANKDGVWNASGATLSITILPPWWKTWWFAPARCCWWPKHRVSGVFHALVGDCAARRRCSNARWARARSEIEQQNRLLEHQKGELEEKRRDAVNQRAEAEQRRADAERQKEEVQRQKEKSSRPTAIFRCCPRSGAN